MGQHILIVTMSIIAFLFLTDLVLLCQIPYNIKKTIPFWKGLIPFSGYYYHIKYNSEIQESRRGPCAKQKVYAILVNNGNFWIGSNWCQTPVKECPRKDLPSGVGYDMCQNICHQSGHAERDVLDQSGIENARGGTIYILGHTYCCDNCKKLMSQYDIKDVVILTNTKELMNITELPPKVIFEIL